MRYYCNKCKKSISDDDYRLSMENFDRAFCKDCKPTDEARKLGNLLRNKGWDVKFEKSDGHKHIDIAIVDAKVNIEVDGKHHSLNAEQALADLKRTYYSFKKEFLTLRIPNCLVQDDKTIEKTAEFINKFLRESFEQLEEDVEVYDDDFWI
jgi:very-short-patch-repair endonuclease